MTTQPALWDALSDALARVEQRAAPDWKHVAAEVVRQLASTRHEFTADDALELLESRYPEVTTHTNRALGPIFLAAQRDGLIINTDRVVKSRLIRRHGRKITVWQSRLVSQ